MTSELDFDFPVANLRPPPRTPIIPSMTNRIKGLMAVTSMAWEHAQYYIQQADKTGRSPIDLFAEDCSYGRLPPTPSRSDMAKSRNIGMEQKAQPTKTSARDLKGIPT